MSTKNSSRSGRIANVLGALGSGTHRAGTLDVHVLEGILRLLPDKEIRSVETGCGKSTVFFSNISEHHTSFCYDDRDMADSSVNFVLANPHFVRENVSFVFGPTQHTLPKHKFPPNEFFDLILIDGPHGFPFPEIEYWHLYPRLAPDGLLIIDDIMIPSIGRMYDILREDRMFHEVAILSTTGVLRRSHDIELPPDGDHWWEQAYNFRHFPISMAKYERRDAYELASDIKFTDLAAVERYSLRGFEFVDKRGISTIDTSAVLRFQCPTENAKELQLTMLVEIDDPDAVLGAGVFVNGVWTADLPRLRQEHSIAFRCPVSSDHVYEIELRLPATKSRHDISGKLDFRRDGCTLKLLRAIAQDGDTGAENSGHVPIPQTEGQLAFSIAETLVGPPQEGLADFNAILRFLSAQIASELGISDGTREITSPPILCPNASSAVRFMPLPRCTPSNSDKSWFQIWSRPKKSFTFVDFFAFDGADFAYAVHRSLLLRGPNKKQVAAAVRGSVGKRFIFLLRVARASRKMKGAGRLKGLRSSRALYAISRWTKKLGLSPLTHILERYLKTRGQRLYIKYRASLEERRSLLATLCALQKT